ncbi:MAG: hypothetical protein KJ670_12580 [Alphaproteobacteria bacterium]|nr:hypothetical protein [Rhizobiaceae bacterium]MBU3959889.1 hypothetical protein [Alphaproteobacteria bacterium]MBU4050799.1 hypothetical protein [Alphaproteobacteria bacterium]MBU4089544.1 hypothetical protein [Alphaproteobacteria bacterium]MBU4155520.1 hypothetical protein [Alphaproteobacteria bacterium]
MQIELTEEEQELINKIEFDPMKVTDHQRWQINSELAFRIITLLLRREAVPNHRIQYFTEPAYNFGGRGKSRRELFLAKAKTYENMFRHNHFLAYLRYFVYGPNLPEELIASFRKAVEACGNITSGDIGPLRTKARALARQYRLNKTSADEFYKLALETMGHSHADSIRDAIMQVK